MGTQATVSIVLDGKVLVKAICGCNGAAAPELAAFLKKEKLTTVESVLKACEELEFGCPDCLVVQDSPTTYLVSEDYDREPLDLCGESRLYKEKFNDPKFNPRWLNGTASYSLVVKLPSEKASPRPVGADFKHHRDGAVGGFSACGLCPCPPACESSLMCSTRF